MEDTQQTGTSFFEIYCRFLDKITDDMYLELSLSETLQIIESIFMESLPEFTYPRFRIGLYDPSLVTSDAIDEDGSPVVTGAFVDELTNEEKDIIAEIMVINWLRRQLNTTRIIQMRYSTSDFKQTSQAAHMQRLNAVILDQQKRVKHKLNLYSKRKMDKDGYLVPNTDNLAGVGTRSRDIIITQLGVVKRNDEYYIS